jgi:hypothetical protein
VLQRIAEQSLPPLAPPPPGSPAGTPPSLQPGGVALALLAAVAAGLRARALAARHAAGTRAVLVLGLLAVAVRLAPRLAAADALPLLRLDLAALGITLLGLYRGAVLAARAAGDARAASARASSPAPATAPLPAHLPGSPPAGVLGPRGLLAVLTGWIVLLGASRLADEAALLGASWAAGRGAPGVGEDGWSALLFEWEQPLLITQFVGAALASTLGGWVVARLAAAAPLRHAVVLAALVALWSLLGLSATRVLHQFAALGSGGLFVAGALLWPACAVAGAVLGLAPGADGAERPTPGSGGRPA